MFDRWAGPRPWPVDLALLAAVTAAVVWAVAAGDRETAAWLGMGSWVLAVGLGFERSTPDVRTPVLALTAAWTAAAAVGLFLLYQWAGWPVVSYLDAVSVGLLALNAATSIWVRQTAPPPGPAGEAPASK